MLLEWALGIRGCRIIHKNTNTRIQQREKKEWCRDMKDSSSYTWFHIERNENGMKGEERIYMSIDFVLRVGVAIMAVRKMFNTSHTHTHTHWGIFIHSLYSFEPGGYEKTISYSLLFLLHRYICVCVCEWGWGGANVNSVILSPPSTKKPIFCSTNISYYYYYYIQHNIAIYIG